MGSNWDKSTPERIKIHPIIFPNPRIWFKIIHAEIVAKTPSRDIIIAAGAAGIFFLN